MNIPESLISKILTKKCILFLGAGATKNSGGVLGNELGKYIYDEIGDIGIDYKDNLARYTQALVNAGYRDSIEMIVRKRFSSLHPNDKFKSIASIPWKAIYTTNYDDLIEKSYSGAGMILLKKFFTMMQWEIYMMTKFKVIFIF